MKAHSNNKLPQPHLNLQSNKTKYHDTMPLTVPQSFPQCQLFKPALQINSVPVWYICHTNITSGYCGSGGTSGCMVSTPHAFFTQKPTSPAHQRCATVYTL